MAGKTSGADVSRRGFLSRITSGVLGLIGGTLAIITGGAAFSSTGRREAGWLPASTLYDLPDNQPTPITLSIARMDGFREVVDRRTVFLVKSGESEVVAFDAACTHLGCLVTWDNQGQVFRCPCHGGVFDRAGGIASGPPPAPLTAINTRIDGVRVLVQV